MRDILLRYIRDKLKKSFPKALAREIDIDKLLLTDHIIDVLGARRAGKTYFLYSIINRLLADGVDRRRIVYINFEDRHLNGVTIDDLDAILDYISAVGIADKYYVFLDEIQVVDSWESWVRTVYDEFKGRIKIFLSGSTSQLAKPEIATKLTGRHLTVELFPLSFREFLSFKGVDVAELTKMDVLPFSDENMIRGLLVEYMEFGGYPEVVLAPEAMKLDILANYYDDILYYDIIRRFKIREIRAMELFLKFIVTNISKYFSYKRTKSMLANFGVKLSLSTIERWTNILEEIYLAFFVPILTRKITIEARYPRKIYLVDIGLRRVVLRRDIEESRLLENMVYLELRRRLKHHQEIRYWQYEKGEVDFIIVDSGEPIIAIQVAESLKNPDTKRREINALRKIIFKHQIESTLIITLNEKTEIQTQRRKFTAIPFWEFALKPEKYLKY